MGEEALSLLQDLLRIDTTNAPDVAPNEIEAAEFLAAHLEMPACETSAEDPIADILHSHDPEATVVQTLIPGFTDALAAALPGSRADRRAQSERRSVRLRRLRLEGLDRRARSGPGAGLTHAPANPWIASRNSSPARSS